MRILEVMVEIGERDGWLQRYVNRCAPVADKPTQPIPFQNIAVSANGAKLDARFAFAYFHISPMWIGFTANGNSVRTLLPPSGEHNLHYLFVPIVSTPVPVYSRLIHLTGNEASTVQMQASPGAFYAGMVEAAVSFEA